MTDLDELEPSTLLLLWPWPEKPLRHEVEARVVAAGGKPASERLDEGWLWSFPFAFKQLPCPVWVLLEKAAIPRASLRQPMWRDDERQRAEQCRWVIAVKTLLTGDDPLLSFHELVRLCYAILPEAPAAYDRCARSMLSATRLRRIATNRIPPDPRTLYSIHAVPPEREAADQTCWIHTHGLWRMRIPEMDLVGVPRDLLIAGGLMIQMAMGALIGRGIPTGVQEIEFGHECTVGFGFWRDVVKCLPAIANGGSRDRVRTGDHVGRRIVLGRFENQRTGTVWRPPIDLLERVNRPGFAALRTTRETERDSARARESWPEFAMLFVRHKQRDWRFLAKIGIECPVERGVPAEREHMWFEVEELQKDRIRGVLLDEPLFVRALRKGHCGWHDLASLSDWVIWTPMGAVSMQNADDGEIFGRAAEAEDAAPEAEA